MEKYATFFLYFMVYSFLGWLMEVICKRIELKRFVNRGFLLGPICPIYGYGVLGIILLIGNNRADILSVFLKAILICSILEYFTSYLMESLFKARWWDYSNKRYNINGRICLETMIPFGVLGCIVIYLIHPLIINIIDYIPSTIRIILSIVLFLLYMIDNIVSFRVMSRIKKEIKKQRSDNTEIIRKKVIKWIDKNSIVYRHIRNAYPKFKIYDITKKIRKKYK